MIKLSTSTNILFNKKNGSYYDIETTLNMCKGAGFLLLDFNFSDYVNIKSCPFLKENWKEWIVSIKRLSNELGIEYYQGHSTIFNFFKDLEDTKKEYQYELLKRSIESSEILGIKWLVMHAGNLEDPSWTKSENLQRNVKEFRKLLSFAREHNIGIAIENMWDKDEYNHEYTSYPEELMELVDELSKEFDNVGICWDFEHGEIMGMDQREILKQLGHRLKATHISDYYNKKVNHTLPFYGVTDWKYALYSLKEIRYEGCLSLEIHNWLTNVPEELIPGAMNHCYEVGQHLIKLIKE